MKGAAEGCCLTARKNCEVSVVAPGYNLMGYSGGQAKTGG